MQIRFEALFHKDIEPSYIFCQGERSWQVSLEVRVFNMPRVPPGNVTGIYYIIIAGLPWECSWQTLKDFTRNQPDGTYLKVDHAEVFPDSTSGWVRMRGRSDFLAALAHLNGGVLDGRSLMADGRNETNWVYLRDFMPCPENTPQTSPTHDYPLNGSSAADASPTYAGSPEYSEWYHQFQPVYPIYQTLQPAYNSSQSPMAMVYAGYISPATPVFVPPPMTRPISISPLTRSDSCVQPPAPVPRNDTSGSMVPMRLIKTEARKIIVTQLPRNATLRGVEEVLYRAGLERHRDLSWEIATYADGSSRGHAFLTFENHLLAKKAVDALDGIEFQGRALRARFAKEGAEPAVKYAPTTSSRRSLPPPQCSNQEHSSTLKSQDVSLSGPLVVNGSCR